MPDTPAESAPELTPYQKWRQQMEADNQILKLSGDIMEAVRSIESCDEQFNVHREAMLDLIAVSERASIKLDKAIEKWKERKQELFVQHMAMPLMDRSVNAIDKYMRRRRYRSISTRANDPAKIQAQALMEKFERENQPPVSTTTDVTTNPTPENPGPTDPEF